LLNTPFIKGLQGLFPPIECRTDTCAIDLFACDLDGTSPVVRLYSHELNIPIYFSTDMTGSDGTTKEQDWLMEGRMERGHYIQCTKDPRDLSALYLVEENVKKHPLSFAKTIRKGDNPSSSNTALKKTIDIAVKPSNLSNELP
jgi:hypothetical protein